jgi:outer membrane protein, heavy metal efflux system
LIWGKTDFDGRLDMVNYMKAALSASILSAIMFLTGICSQASAQPADSNVPTSLADYLKLAELNNAELKAAMEGWTTALEEIPQAKSLSDPVISYGYATKPTPQRSEFEVMQMFPWFGTIEARTGVASAMAKSAGKQYEAKKLTLFYEVKQAFYEYSYLGKAVEITKENLELLRHFEQVARTKYATSTATHPDVIRAQIELAELENELVSLEKQRPAAVARLNGILNRPAGSELPWPKEAEYKQVSIDRQMLFVIVSQNNPELKALDYQIEAAKSGKKLAEKRFYPEFGVGVGVDAGMGKDMHSRTMPKIQLSLPIWRDNYKAGERQAQAQLRQAKQEQIQKTNDLAASAEQTWYEFENSQRKIVLYRDVIIPKAKEMLTASETAYQAGTIDFLSLIDAQRKFLEYRLVYERTLANNAQKLAELEMLCGTELPAVQKVNNPENK